MAAGLPIKIVVLTIMGMAGLSAMLTFIHNSEKAIPDSLHVDVKGDNLIILSELSDTDPILIPVEVMGGRNGVAVEKASVVLSGPDIVEINRTNSNGMSILKFNNKSSINFGANEGYLRLDVRATGFQDYSNEYAVKIVK